MFDAIDYDASIGEYQQPSGPIVPDAIDCMRCGQCLASCPTYQLTNDEQEGPRQRVRTLSLLWQEKQEVSAEAIKHLQNCLQCKACEAVCPSRMDYGELFDLAQIQLTATQKRGFYSTLALFLVANQKALNTLLPMIRVYQVSGLRWLLRKSKLLDLVGLSRADSISPVPVLDAMKPCYPVSSTTGTVALFSGCIADRFDRETLLSAIKVLNHIGYTVLVPKHQNCCGAIHYHNGEQECAETLMRNNVEAFCELSVNAVIYCATGCGSQLQNTVGLLQDDNQRLTVFKDKLMEVCEFVDRHWPDNLALKPYQAKVIVHEPCSQRNMLRNQSAIYRLLQRIPDLNVDALAENHLCCGAGGSYMLTHPDNADALRERKWAHVKQSRADTLVTTNIGCALHLKGADASKPSVQIMHPITLIADRM